VRTPIDCAGCHRRIPVGQPRYKQRSAPHDSMCELCAPPAGPARDEAFMSLRNNVVDVRARWQWASRSAG
jgi:hypothetical protein